MKKYYLYTRDSKGKIRVMIITVTVTKNGDNVEVFSIARQTGELNGKLIDQPVVNITKGKSKRTAREQAILETKSIISKQRDKGYKLYEELIEAFKVDEVLILKVEGPTDYKAIDTMMSKEKSDASGNRKPNLAKDTNVLKTADKEKGTNKFDLLLARAWWGSYKLDGIRTKAGVKDGKLNFLSKSGKPYLGVSKHFVSDPELIEFCRKYSCEIDGEFYVHGMPLKDINGHCQKEQYIPERHDQIKLYIFDMAVDGMDASERCKILNEFKVSNARVVILKHKYLVGKEQCLAFEKEAVDDGYEGAMLRTTTGMYEWGKRSKELWKLKPFQDAEGVVSGISEGAREEDMCFIMTTEDGVEFKASIIGDRDEKQEYRKNFDKLYKGKKGTYKFQYFTPDGKPFLPKFKCFREDE